MNYEIYGGKVYAASEYATYAIIYAQNSSKSNIPINVEYSYEKKTGYTDVSGTFYSDKECLNKIDSAVTLSDPNINKTNAYLGLKGSLYTSISGETIGSAKVTLKEGTIN